MTLSRQRVNTLGPVRISSKEKNLLRGENIKSKNRSQGWAKYVTEQIGSQERLSSKGKESLYYSRSKIKSRREKPC